MFMTDQDMAAIFDAVGDGCTFKANGLGDGVAIKATLSTRPAEVLSGEQISTQYEVRVASAAVGGAVQRNATFTFGTTTYKATQYGQPLHDQAELVVPVRRV
jgi:hypothetical protein